MFDVLKRRIERLVFGNPMPVSLAVLTLLIIWLFYLNGSMGRWYYLIVLGLVAAMSVAFLMEASATLTRRLPGKKYPVVYRLVMLGVGSMAAGIAWMLHQAGYFYGDHPSLALSFEILFGGTTLAMALFKKTPSREVDPADRKRDL